MNKYAYTPRWADNFSVKELDDMNRKLDAWLRAREKHKPEGSMTFKESNNMHFAKNKAARNRTESGYASICLIVALSLACAAFLCWSALYVAKSIAKARVGNLASFRPARLPVAYKLRGNWIIKVSKEETLFVPVDNRSDVKLIEDQGQTVKL